MSKYTTEVRYILEHDAGLTESGGADDIDDIVDAAWDKTFKAPATGGPVIGSALYTERIEKLILKNYYFREIGAETVGLWKTWMRTTMDEIADYYDAIYNASAAVNIEKALQDVDYTRMHSGTGQQARTRQSSSQDADTTVTNNTGTVTDSGTSSNTIKSSDTPQGGLTGLANDTYLTEASIQSGSAGNTRTDNTQQTTNAMRNNTGTETDNASSTDAFTETVRGKIGGKTFTEMMTGYRDAVLDLDRMIIDEFKDHFINLW